MVCNIFLAGSRSPAQTLDFTFVLFFYRNSASSKDNTIKICDDRRLVVTSSFAFYIITFEPIEVQTRSAPQNDRLNLSFMKNVDGGKLARNGRKMVILSGRWGQLPIDDENAALL